MLRMIEVKIVRVVSGLMFDDDRLQVQIILHVDIYAAILAFGHIPTKM